MVTPTQEGGEARKQLLINSALLYLIDPSRGAPTKSLIDGPLDDDVLKNHQLKEKFLDSFALICSTSSSGKETASAVCMELNRPSGTILRVARNRGLSEQDLTKLRAVIQALTAASHGEKSSIQAETEILEKVVDLDEDRIMALVEKLEKGGIRHVFQVAITKLSGNHCNEERLKEPAFVQWIKKCPFMATSMSSSGTSHLISLIQWAMQARWVYHKQLQILLAFSPKNTPLWVETFYKLARYWGAIKSMVKLAIKQPKVFASIQVQGVQAPLQQSFSLFQEKTTLQRTLKRLVKDDCNVTMAKLAQRWETDDVEGKLRKACRLTLTLHAEMQLLDFYDRNPSLVPQFRLMGTSKKACFLCNEFLLLHPLDIQALACHQKVYPTWMPPYSRESLGVAGNKIFWNFSKHIERVTVKELKTGLAASRRPSTKDSTAGPTLTKTATAPTEALVRYTTRRREPYKGWIMENGGYQRTLGGF
ncbi:hypothetical protein BX600DRAFT_538141 [Xylariales sp. PMI_506]|nr:hypothetical protein BX600DRAFT_538141 [Xylariales sp. PMI_506]